MLFMFARPVIMRSPDPWATLWWRCTRQLVWWRESTPDAAVLAGRSRIRRSSIRARGYRPTIVCSKYSPLSLAIVGLLRRPAGASAFAKEIELKARRPRIALSSVVDRIEVSSICFLLARPVSGGHMFHLSIPILDFLAKPDIRHAPDLLTPMVWSVNHQQG